MPDLMFPQTSAVSERARSASLAIFLLIIAIGVAFVAVHLVIDLEPVQQSSAFPYVLLGFAMLIALGFEFVNGFHDTANAVATVIYTHSLTPNLAVLWSGAWNFAGVLVSSGAVAFGILQLLPVELILQVGGHAGFAMVFALLIAAITWNLATWYFGLPSSSSHTLIGSIIGVGLMNQLMRGPSGTSGVDWTQALGVGKSLLFSPIVGFLFAGLLLLVLKAVVRVPALYTEPVGNKPPPLWIRSLLILTCTGVSFAHGSNDGQKGMGLIMLILIGTVPTAYALNKAVTPAQTQAFVTVAHQASAVFGRYAPGSTPSASPREEVEAYVRTRQMTPATLPAVRQLTDIVAGQITAAGSISTVPPSYVSGIRGDSSDGEVEAARLRGRRSSRYRQLHAATQSRDQVHPDMGQGRGCHCAGTRHDGRLEADCRDGRRENWQAALDLRPRCVGGGGRDADHRGGGSVRTPGIDHAHTYLRRRRYDGGEWLRPSMEHPAKPGAGLGAHASGIHCVGCSALLAVSRDVLSAACQSTCLPGACCKQGD